jgi:bacterial/archaeal transporter family-2 protein
LDLRSADYPPGAPRLPGNAEPKANGDPMLAAFVLFGLAAGAMLPFQAGVNAQLAEYLGSPLRAALVSFVVGTLALLVVVALFVRGLPASDRIGAAPWWTWIGGALGAFYVAGSITAAPRLGAVTLIGVILAGQAVASLVVDHFGMVGFDEHPATLGRIAGLGLIALGVLFVRLF